MAIYRGTGSASSTSDQATIDEVTTQATNAANSATSAASSATSASTSASSASSSATSAATSATTATNKASEASASASAASDSAGLASTSETNAATSATSASLSASQAAASATNASGSQTAAETAQAAAESAVTDAETAQTAAETAATNSTSSATASATSATNAANSATASANSATASATSATAAQTAQTNAETAETNAEAALDEFTDLYLGVKSSAPTLDNDGDALQTGALYYDSTGEQLYIWDGSAWDQAAFSVSGAVTSFNTRTGAVTLSSGDVTTALGYTPYNSTNPNSYVVQSDIDTSIANLVDSAPATLDTLNELAAALGDDANFSTTVTNSLATKAPLASPALTGTPTAPTATANTNTTQLATTAYVQGELANEANWNTAYGWGDHGVEGYLTDYTVTQGDVTQHQAALSITESQISDLGSYLTGNQTITLSGDVSGSGTTSISVTVADDSHNHVISNVDNLQTTLDGKVDVSGDTMTGALNFGDNVKAQFGASNDLQIYHDGSNSFIDDAGTGNVFLRGSSQVIIGNMTGEQAAVFNDNGAVTINYDNAQKLATTSYGVDISGSVVADTNTSVGVGATPTPDMSTYQNFIWTLNANANLGNPSTEKVGQTGFFVFIQDATGGRTLSLGSEYKTAGGAGITLSTAANAVDIVPYIVQTTGTILLGTPQLAFS